MIQNNDFRYELNKPAMMAVDDDDDIFDEDSSSDSDSDSAPVASSAPETETQADSSNERNSTGITRSSVGFGVLTLLSLIPISMMVLYMLGGLGLSFSAMLFMVTFSIGFLLSVWTFSYYRKGTSSFTKFDVHSFLKWPEIITISVVLMLVSFYNISNLSSGNALSLSSESTVTAKAKAPAPIFAPQPPQSNHFEENEVLYDSKENTPISGKKEVAVKKQTRIHREPVATQPIRQPEHKVVETKAVESKTEVPKAETKVVEPVKNNKAEDTKVKQVKAHEDEEGTATSKGVKIDTPVNEAAEIAKISAGVTAKINGNAKVSGVSMEVETPSMVSSLFLGGILCAALGYAFALALAGGILGLFRKFNNPFSAKTKELVNEETGEITLETESQSGGAKAMDYVFRFFVGFNLGGTAGFLLGLFITLPLYILFWDKAQSEPLLANFLTTLGVVKNPDLAYGTGIAIAGLIVPLVMMVVGKSSPSGRSLTEEEVRQVYSIPVTVNKVSNAVATIPEPAIVSFDLDSSRERDGLLVDDFSDDDDQESITQELAEEFGMDLEKTFGIKNNAPERVHSGNGNGNGHHVTEHEKQRINEILENSLGELGNVSVQVSAELGRATIMLSDWLNLSEGMLIELDKPASQEIDILINDVCKGKGKIAVVDNHLSVKVSKANFSQSVN